MRRIERLINLIAALLDTRRPLTANEIRERIAGYQTENVEAFRRAFERDKAELREMGIPIELVKDDEDHDAYLIPPQKYYMPDLDLQPDELAALKLAADAVLGAGDQASAALRKLSVGSEDDAVSTPQVVWGADVAAEQPLLGPLLSALVDKRPLHFEYEAGDGERTHRHIRPYSLVHRRGHWYLIGLDVDRDAIRSFKVSRIVEEPRAGQGSYEVPSDLDVEAHVGVEPWEIGSGERTQALIRFDPELAWWPRQNMRDLASKDLSDGTSEISMPVTNYDALVSWVLGFGDRVEIVEPKEAREALRRHLAPFLRSSA
jgi:proteasome accessory factor B